MSLQFDPLSIATILLMQIGGRYLNFNLTKAQEKMISHPYIQGIIFFSIIYITTKNIYLSVVILMITFISINILFNENHKYNIISKTWLNNEGISINGDIIDLKKLYYESFNSLHD